MSDDVAWTSNTSLSGPHHHQSSHAVMLAVHGLLRYTAAQARTKCKRLSLHAANNGFNFYHALQILIELWHVAEPVTFRSTSFK